MLDRPASAFRSLTDLDGLLTYRLARLQARLNADAVQRLRSCTAVSLTQWRVMVAIHTLEDTTLAELVHALRFDKGQLSRAVAGLTAAGLVRAKVDKADSRRQRLRLTDDGAAEYAKILPRMRRRNADLTEGLTEGETETLFATLDKIGAVLDAREAP